MSRAKLHGTIIDDTVFKEANLDGTILQFGIRGSEVKSVDDCAICMKSNNKQIGWKLPCGHMFHKACVMQRKPKANCPLCGKDAKDYDNVTFANPRKRTRTHTRQDGTADGTADSAADVGVADVSVEDEE
jgi:hypothetical protein